MLVPANTNAFPLAQAAFAACLAAVVPMIPVGRGTVAIGSEGYSYELRSQAFMATLGSRS
jgi:hypothetical protein